MKSLNKILLFIVLSQFAGTSLWFAGNAVVKDIIAAFSLPADALSYITSAVQLGFIAGTLVSAIFAIADRFSPSKVFFLCALFGAISNLSLLWADSLLLILLSRFITGFFLAGIYPVGMKIAADYHDKGLGKALGYLVGALVFGTAFPHFVNAWMAGLNWKYVIAVVSAIAVCGGLLVLLFIPDGPYRRMGSKPDFKAAFRLFGNKQFRSTAIGYFGHMWELYTFWTLVPVVLTAYLSANGMNLQQLSIYSFTIIAVGSIGCVAGGYIALKKGSAKTAFAALLISSLCCLSLVFFIQLPFVLFFAFMLVWGMAVVADSPQFTTLVAQSVDAGIRGSALTIVNSIGFAITVVSIQTITLLKSYIDIQYVFLLLAIGPLIGLWGIRKAFSKPYSL